MFRAEKLISYSIAKDKYSGEMREFIETYIDIRYILYFIFFFAGYTFMKNIAVMNEKIFKLIN